MNKKKILLYVLVLACTTPLYIISMGNVSDKTNGRALFVMAARLASKMQLLKERADFNLPFVKKDMGLLDLLILDQQAVDTAYKETYSGYDLPSFTNEIHIQFNEERQYEYAGYHIAGVEQSGENVIAVFYRGLPMLVVSQMEAIYDKGKTDPPENSGIIRYRKAENGYLMGIYLTY